MAMGGRRNRNPNSAADDPLDLFDDDDDDDNDYYSDVPTVKLGRLSLGSARQQQQQQQGKSTGLNDLHLLVGGGGKNDYDWLLTPPGTPLFPSLDDNGSQGGRMAPRSGHLVRSTSTSKASRLSISQSENNHAAKPTRSSSATRPSAASSQHKTYSNKSTSILNTSSSSVSSYVRSSTPTNRSSSITRSSTPSSRPSVSRSTTPAKPRPSLTTSSMDKPRPSQNSRPSTPTSRPQISANLSSSAGRNTSRPSTPTRRNPSPSLSPVSVSGTSTLGGRSLTNGRSTVASVSRPSSPGPRVRNPPQPIALDFSLETPPNLRTSLPDRPISAGRSRPGAALTARGNIEPTPNIATARRQSSPTPNTASARRQSSPTPNTATARRQSSPTPNTAIVRRQSSPGVTRGRLAEPTGRSRALGNGHLTDAMDSRREVSTQKPAKTSTDNTGFGRTISKKSLDMAIRHMDIRTSSNGFRPLTGSNLFPQSIRSPAQKIQPVAASANGNLFASSNGAISENSYRFSESGSEEDKSHSSAKLSNNDIYESSRYDMILLKEDLKNSNWLHGLDDKSDQGPIFDNGFELLPEPFDPL